VTVGPLFARVASWHDIFDLPVATPAELSRVDRIAGPSLNRR
jgi:hypothetical protein